MTIKEQIIQELDRIPESYLWKVLGFLYSLETPSGHDAGLSNKVDLIIQKGLNNAISKPKRSASEIWAEFELLSIWVSLLGYQLKTGQLALQGF